MSNFKKVSPKPKRAESPDESGRGRICAGLGWLVGDFLVLFFTHILPIIKGIIHASSVFKGVHEHCVVREGYAVRQKKYVRE